MSLAGYWLVLLWLWTGLWPAHDDGEEEDGDDKYDEHDKKDDEDMQ